MTKTYAQLVQEMELEQDPSDETLAEMRLVINLILSALYVDLDRFVLNLDRAYELVRAKFAEVMDVAKLDAAWKVRQIRVIKSSPGPNHIGLGNTQISSAPGLFEVRVIWAKGIIDVCLEQVPTGNLRDASVEASISA